MQAEKGCPECIQHLACKNYNAVLNKRAGMIVLRHLLEAEEAHAQRAEDESAEAEAAAMAAMAGFAADAS